MPFSNLKNKLVLRWLANRIPGNTRHKMNLHSIFIFPTLFGFCFLVLCFGLFILGTNYQNNLLLLLSYFFFAIVLVTLFTSYRNFSRIQIQARGVNPVFAGDNATFQMQLEHDSAQLPHGELKIHWWQHASGIVVDLDETCAVISLPRFTYRRGLFALPRVTFSSQFPLGLFKCWTHLDFNQPLTVFPKQQTAPIMLSTLANGGVETGAYVHGHDDFEGLKAYRIGDPLNRIAWQTVAKGRDPAVKLFSEQGGEAGYLIVDIHSHNLESHLSQIAYQAVVLCRQDISFGLKAGKQIIPHSSGLEHRNRCLSALAGIPIQKDLHHE
ncbi:DUF58 domain-containing protein [Alteromonas lipotrueiana]|uniref:DUF58 domain-containing protein n=1 Tax=Alteromonas lipotrueiana TaxID=2803815 RepID=UPI001C44AFDE|nr:DUF58 domain-containing protein [Alteromonas lipotrueiana]